MEDFGSIESPAGRFLTFFSGSKTVRVFSRVR